MFNLELLMFHCVVWIGYSFLTDAQLITVGVPLCGVDRVFLLDRFINFGPQLATGPNYKKMFVGNVRLWSIANQKFHDLIY
jgi:hypothetical protein